ncbi:helix-turn-helix transcriptional regulator [Paraburkholderia phymatum]|uniref:Helix-turn-helix transcriptional regulator n=1 Tax=Paraburkholderia phymatum TaxID=148447 RepID=A0ACC6UBU8_9BURK
MNTEDFVQRLVQQSAFHLQRTDKSKEGGNYRLVPPPGIALGQVECYYDYKNPSLTIRRFKTTSAFHDDEHGLGRIVFLLHLSGTRRLELGSDVSHVLERPTLAVYYQPVGVDKRSVWISDTEEVSLTIGVWPETLISLYGFYPSCLPMFAEREGSNSAVFWHSRPLPYTLISAAKQLVSGGVHLSLAKNYLSIKSQELLCLSLSTLMSDGELHAKPDVAQSRTESIKTIIDSNLKTPPSLLDLATDFGISVQELSTEIRRSFGVSYLQYITERRMKRAMLLLESGDTALKRLAFEVGYQHTSNFCTAFKRHFGTTPKDARVK